MNLLFITKVKKKSKIHLLKNLFVQPEKQNALQKEKKLDKQVNQILPVFIKKINKILLQFKLEKETKNKTIVFYA